MVRAEGLFIGMEIISSQAIINSELMVDGTQLQDGYCRVISLGGHILCKLKHFEPIFENTWFLDVIFPSS